MPFCGASKTKSSAQQVKKGAESASRAIPLQNGNGAAPVKNEAVNQAAVDQQIAQYKQESAAKHQEEVAQWEQKFDEKITEVKTKQAQKHEQEINTIQQQQEQERSQHQSEVEALQAEIAALQQAETTVVHNSAPRALSVHESNVAPAPVVETVSTRSSTVPTTVVPTTTSVVPLGSTTSTVERTYTTQSTVPVTTYPVSNNVYENTTIPTGEGLPDTKVTYSVISDETATAAPRTYTTESAPRTYTSEYTQSVEPVTHTWTETAPRAYTEYVTRSAEPVTHTYVTETAPRTSVYENTTIPTGEGLPDTKVTYSVISDATTTAVPTTYTETATHTYTETAPRVSTEYVTKSVEPAGETAGDYKLVNGNYVFSGSHTTTSVPTTYSTTAPAANQFVDEL